MTGVQSYTPEELAKILKITRFTVYEMIKRGDLPAYRIGRKVRVEAADLDQFINKSKGMANPVPILPESGSKLTEVGTDDLVICGQDASLDILTRHLQRQLPQVRLLRNYIGSIDGLMALYHGKANVVSAHLWDSDSDSYNTPYVRRLLPGHRTLLINLVYRIEGFYVVKGNPKQILIWQDLCREDVRFVNRECGSGARVLLDEKLRIHNIDHAQVNGYGDEEMSHLAVASRVARGEADVGLGIEKAALQVKELEFIPLQKERYDLIIRREDAGKPSFKVLLSTLRSPQFQNELRGVGGYDLSRTGEIVAEI